MDKISGTQQAMIMLAIVMCVGFTGFTLFAIVPLVRLGKEMLGSIKTMMEVLQKTTEYTVSKIPALPSNPKVSKISMSVEQDNSALHRGPDFQSFKAINNGFLDNLKNQEGDDE